VFVVHLSKRSSYSFRVYTLSTHSIKKWLWWRYKCF